MGLAPYGEPKYLDQMREIVHLHDDGSFSLNLDYFRHAREKVAYKWEQGSPSAGTLFTPALETLLGPARKASEDLEQQHKDVAPSVQAMYVEAFFHLLNALHRRYPVPAVCVAGGCGMNSVANGKITLRTPFTQVYVQSAAGDAGGAIGAPMAVWHEQGPVRSQPMLHAYLGPGCDDQEINALLEARAQEIAAAGCTRQSLADERALCRRTAQAVADGEVVGWFQGRMEWGPRAFGNRSIIGDPRRADMKDILNLKIKRRESFRPFAPSILREAV